MNKRRILFRADGNTEIGLGHVVRSLALAEILIDFFECVFITRYPNKLIQEYLKKGIKIVQIPQSDEHLKDFLKILNSQDIVVLDNYFFRTEHQIEIKRRVHKLVCIDDLHDQYFVADVVINHSPSVTKEQYQALPTTRLCLGLDYALLRKPFFNLSHRCNFKAESCLICIGGSDPDNISFNLVKLLFKYKQIKKINLVSRVGSIYTNQFKEEELNTKKINIYNNLSDVELIKLMQESDFAILPSSTVSIEALAVGIPFLTGWFVDNQKELYDYYTSQLNIAGLGNLKQVNSLNLKFDQRLPIKFDSAKLLEVFKQLL
ncbi:MAG: UDP-2,4-diacetamido-2,4,6-trideoxy-beta-L-altropyranose hydrolase [Marinifilaceae bacterium]|jgi:UDP-2,4-diacetamido-2,4,6-trideoxy-beta-L-altropyranose hydrolase|nr:UDP-2,4-diacetamido-2,4,6-trideoxy-beta-L-altropyranose hydrolase [Marinifilaceae bacterium]